VTSSLAGIIRTIIKKVNKYLAIVSMLDIKEYSELQCVCVSVQDAVFKMCYPILKSSYFMLKIRKLTLNVLCECTIWQPGRD
jgi:predicted CDP-diglyceride synthetase/phosphatidate cytidylyltransferase